MSNNPNIPQANPYNVVASSGFQPNPGVYMPPVNYGHPPGQPPMPPHMMGAPMMPPPGYGPPPGAGGYHQYQLPPPPMQQPEHQQHHHPPPQQPSGGESYSFLDPILPTQKKESVFQGLLKPQKDKIVDVYKKLYVGKIPQDIPGNPPYNINIYYHIDTLMERLFKCCGIVESWTRAVDASGVPKKFGYCEFEDVDAAIVCLKTMNGLIVAQNNLTVSYNYQINIFA